eukprot:12579688-Alexandrium_andersonii.AAC.1
MTPFALALGPVRTLGPCEGSGLATLTADLARVVSRASQQLERCSQLAGIDIALNPVIQPS